LFWKSNLRTEQEHGARKEQTADIEGGYSDDPAAVSKVVARRRKAAEKGVAEDRKANVNAAVRMNTGSELDDE